MTLAATKQPSSSSLSRHQSHRASPMRQVMQPLANASNSNITTSNQTTNQSSNPTFLKKQSSISGIKRPVSVASRSVSAKLRPPMRSSSSLGSSSKSNSGSVSVQKNLQFRPSEFARTRLLQEFELVFKEYLKAKEMETNRAKIAY